jgi:hypothetical protein
MPFGGDEILDRAAEDGVAGVALEIPPIINGPKHDSNLS